MELKSGARVRGIKPEMLMAVFAAQPIWQAQGSSLTITSGVDGEHSPGSLHYAGAALDFRVWDLKDQADAAEQLQEALGEDFDVLDEGTHIHVEYQPKNPLNE